MKKRLLKTTLILVGLAFMINISAQVQINFVPDSVASLGVLFQTQVDYDYLVTTPDFELTDSPDGMTINSTGLISWTPSDIGDGGPVTIRCFNAGGEDFYSFNAYVTDEIVCDPDIVSYWDMNKIVSNSVADYAGGYDADLLGNTDPVVSPYGIVGNCLEFIPDDIFDSFMEAPDDDQYDEQYEDDFSISVWFKNKPTLINPAQTQEVMLAKSSNPIQGRWKLYYADDNYVHFDIHDNTTDQHSFKKRKTINDTNWHHVVVTVNLRQGTPPGDTLDSYFQMYVDNEVFDTAMRLTTENVTGDGGIDFGSWDDSGSNKIPFSGALDEVAYFGKRLSSSEVTDLYNKGLAGTPICQPGNIAPVITSDPVTSVDEDSPYSYDMDYSEIDGDPVTLGYTVKPSWMSFNSSTGELTGLPTNDNVGDTTATLTVSDGTVTIEHTFSITVNNTNDVPIVTSAGPDLAVDEDSPYSYTFEAMDVDVGDAVTLSAPVLPTWLDFDAGTGVLSATPTNDQVGFDATVDYDVTLRATDNFAEYTELSFTITVTNINDAPVIDSQNSISTDEDVNIDITFADLNVTDVDDVYPDDFTLTVMDGTDYTHSGNSIILEENWNGNLTVPIQLSDGDVTLDQDLTVVVNAVNDAPEFTSDPIETANSNELYQYWITSDDVEEDELTLTCTSKPDWLTFTENNGEGILQGTPTNDDAGTVTVSLELTDGENTVEQSYFLTVNPSGVELNMIDNISVYPVPAKEQVTLSLGDVLSNINLKVYSMAGTVLIEKSFDSQKEIDLDVSGLNAGQYVYILISDEGYHKGSILIK